MEVFVKNFIKYVMFGFFISIVGFWPLHAMGPKDSLAHERALIATLGECYKKLSAKWCPQKSNTVECNAFIGLGRVVQSLCDGNISAQERIRNVTGPLGFARCDIDYLSHDGSYHTYAWTSVPCVCMNGPYALMSCYRVPVEDRSVLDEMVYTMTLVDEAVSAFGCRMTSEQGSGAERPVAAVVPKQEPFRVESQQQDPPHAVLTAKDIVTLVGDVRLYE
jgi:hypothetical protein